jgi:calnexin
MQNDILFDNIYIGHSVMDAEKFAEKTFHKKHATEKLLELAEKPAEEAKPISPFDRKFMDDPVLYVKEKLELFITIAQNNPMEAVKFVPEVAGGIAAVIITVLALIIGLFSMGGSTPPPKVKKAAESTKVPAADTKKKVVDATTSAVDQGKGEANKRSTRSTPQI